jgi:hypothetical protein
LSRQRRNSSDGRYKRAPFLADISFGDGGAEVEIKKAGLCGMDTPGVVKVSDNYVSLNVEPSCESHEIESAFRCLLNHDVRATGTFELYGRRSCRKSGPKGSLTPSPA